VVLKCNETHELLVNANDADIFGDNVIIVKKNNKILIDASNVIGLEVNS
jgi:hypothetical protein